LHRGVDKVNSKLAADGIGFQSLPVEVITAPTLRLDAPTDRERLSNTVQARQPRLLILDPLIRLHRVDENDASQIAALLSYLRQLQRTFHVAILVVHHARKDANATRRMCCNFVVEPKVGVENREFS
jgi:predicted ATP-dependent serine protease